MADIIFKNTTKFKLICINFMCECIQKILEDIPENETVTQNQIKEVLKVYLGDNINDFIDAAIEEMKYDPRIKENDFTEFDIDDKNYLPF